MGGDRLQSIIGASKIHGDNLHAELQNKIIENPIFQCQYHKSCVAKYLTKAKRLSENLKQETSALSQPPAKRTRSSMGDPFDWLSQCFYCGKRCDVFPDSKHPDRWNPAYLIRETEMKTTTDGTAKKDTLETRIKAQCNERGDKWGSDILERLASLTVRAADLHAADARYHRDCYARFFSGRSSSGHSELDMSTETQSAIQLLVEDLHSRRNERWDSVWLMERYIELGGKQMRRSTLINSLCEMLDDLVVLSAPGYRSVIFFRDNTTATLKMIKDEGEEDNLEAALHLVAKQIKKECTKIEYQHQKYSTKISKEIAAESISDTLLQLLSELSPGDQHLPSLLIGNIITSSITKHPTPLQIAIAVFFHKKKIIKHVHDYLVCCSYDELLRFKRSSAVAKYTQMCCQRQNPIHVEGLVQVIVDNFDAELSSLNGLVSTHELATIETHSKTPSYTVSTTIPRISKNAMTIPIGFEEEDDIILYTGKEKPVPPPLPPLDLPDEYFKAQEISYSRADYMDFTFLKVRPKCINEYWSFQYQININTK